VSYTFTSLIWVVSDLAEPYFVKGTALPNLVLASTNDPQYGSISGSFCVSLISGSIPGLTWSTSPASNGAGKFTGTPTTNGLYSLTFEASYTRNPTASFQVGEIIIDPNGHVQLCVTAGDSYTSGHAAPTWSTSGGTTVDGTILWQDKGVATGIPTITITFEVRTAASTIGSFDGLPGVAGQPAFFSTFGTSTASPAYTASVISGSLPPGTVLYQFPTGLDYGIFAVFGKCARSGVYQFQIQVTGSLGDVDHLYCLLIVLPSQTSNFFYNLTSVPAAPSSTAYSFTFGQGMGSGRAFHYSPAANYAGPYTFTKNTGLGAWPSWLSLSSGGMLSGTAPTYPTGQYFGYALLVNVVSASSHAMGTFQFVLNLFGGSPPVVQLASWQPGPWIL
jgi:hypothetical protein